MTIHRHRKTGHLELAVEMLPVYAKVRLAREMAALADGNLCGSEVARQYASMVYAERDRAAEAIEYEEADPCRG